MVQFSGSTIGPAGSDPLEFPTKDGPKFKAKLVGERVYCKAFPFVVITSNREREFAPAFLRRCVQLRMGPPDDPVRRREWLKGVVQAQFDDYKDEDEYRAHCETLVAAFANLEEGQRATDQLLNALHAIKGLDVREKAGREDLQRLLFERLDPKGPS